MSSARRRRWCSAARARPAAGWRSGSRRAGVPVRIGSRSGEPPFDWEDPAPGRRRCAAWRRSTSRTTRTWRCRAPPTRSARSPSWPCRAACGGWCCSPAAARTRPALRGGRAGVRRSTGRSCAPAGSTRTSARATCWSRCSAGEVALPAGDVGEPFIDADDIADVAVAALTEDGHAGQLYEVTGPRLLTFAEAVAEIARAAGREISLRAGRLTSEYAAAAEAGRAGRRSSWLHHLSLHRGPGRPQRLVTDGVQRALGRAPRDFTEYARDAAATGVWDEAAPRSGEDVRAVSDGLEPLIP